MTASHAGDGRNVLVVEDEVLISMLIETILTDAGYTVEVVANIPEALAAIDSAPPDVAILDLNLAGKKVYPVADRLAQDGIPFVFATGGGGHDIDGYPGRPWVAKPFQEHELLNAMGRLLA
jgi:CheY-like chemotaxis protein